MTDTVRVDYSTKAGVASMVIGGMSVVERVLREAARAGADRAIVIGDAAQLPRLPAVGLAVEIVATPGDAPADARAIPGDVIAGVQISDQRSRRQAERALLETCRRPYDGVGDHYVIRPLSLRITGVLARLHATPNQVTIANIVIGLMACGLAQHGTVAAFAAAGGLMFAQVVLDSSDGELARIRYLSSRVGMWLDNVSDDVIDNLFVASLGIGLGGWWMIVAIGAAILRGACALMIFVAVARAGKPGDVLSFRWWFDRDDGEVTERLAPRLTPLAVARGLGRRDLYVLVWSATCVARLPVVALVLGAAVGVGYFGLAVAHVVITRRRRAAA